MSARISKVGPIKALMGLLGWQQIILSAYYAADDAGDGWISRKAFKSLLEHLLYFHAEWEHFEAIDVDEQSNHHRWV